MLDLFAALGFVTCIGGATFGIAAAIASFLQLRDDQRALRHRVNELEQANNGASQDEIARIAKKSGAPHVHIVSVLRAMRDHDD